MAAPIFQQQGTLAGVTTGNLTVVIPAVEQADDILVVTTVAWVVNTTTGANTIAAPSGWTKFTPAVTTITGGLIDAEYSFFWKRAVGADADPVFVRPAGWDTGNDTVWAGRCYVIRGCVTTGDPWDSITSTAISTAQNPAFPAITVSGNERLAVVFAVKADNASLPTAATGYTAQLEATTTTGTDAAANSYTIASTNTSVSAVTPSGGNAPAQGGTVYFGVSFKPPAAAVIDRTATGSGTGTESSTGVRFAVLDRTATGSGTGTESATGEFTTPAIISRTADGSGLGTETAVGSRVIAKIARGIGSSAVSAQPSSLNSALTSVDIATFWIAQTFAGTGSVLDSIRINMNENGNTGNTVAIVDIYALTGTLASGTPTGSVLATSGNVTIPTSSVGQPTFFPFAGINRIVLSNGVNYAFVVRYVSGTNGYQIRFNFDTNLVDGAYASSSNSGGSWTSLGAARELIYGVYGADATGVTTRTRTATGSGLGAETTSSEISFLIKKKYVLIL